MQFVSGGAYNGKANWVKSHYELNEKNKDDYRWISAYHDDTFPKDLTIFSERTIVIEGLEQWTLQFIKTDDIDKVRHKLQTILQQWRQWTDGKGNQLIIIGTDISKGVVPVDANLRKWRDVTGFIYQDIVKNCTGFYYVWYGIGEQLK